MTSRRSSSPATRLSLALALLVLGGCSIVSRFDEFEPDDSETDAGRDARRDAGFDASAAADAGPIDATVPMDTRVCTPGESLCESTTTRSVCRPDGSGVDTVACGASEVCSAGACVARVCEPATAACVDGATSHVCNADGLGFAPDMPCGDMGSCDSTTGMCRSWVCPPSTIVCEGNSTRACSPDGLSYRDTPCSATQTCRDGACQDWTCTPTSATCTDLVTRSVCASDGLSTSAESCPAMTACLAGACTPWTCTPGTVGSTCAGPTSQSLCGADGQGFTSARTCAAGESCASGVCGVRCGDSVIGSGETCDDGNAASGDGCSSMCESETCGYASFDGAGYMRAGSFNLPDVAHTVEAWIRVGASGNRPILSIGRLTFTARATQRDLVVQYTAHNTWSITSRATPLVVGSWHHVAYTYGGMGYASPGSMNLFVDGVPYALSFEGNATRNPLPTTGGTDIGREVTESSPAYRFYRGDLRSIRVSSGLRYTGAFAPSRSYGADATTRVFWPLDDGSGSLANDLVGTNAATLYPGATWGRGVCDEVCGNAVTEVGETCDDGNLTNGDGCSSTCSYEYEGLVRSHGAIALWNFEETSGTTVTDIIGGRIGTLSGTVTQNVPGLSAHSPNALGLTASGRFNVPRDAALQPASYSVEVWLRPDDCSTSLSVMHNGPGSTFEGWGFFSNAGEVAWEVASSAPALWATVRTGCTVGTTMHLVGVYAPGTMTLYRNGALVGSTPATQIVSTAYLTIGGRSDGMSWRGTMDDLAFYPRALTPAEVAQHYTAR